MRVLGGVMERDRKERGGARVALCCVLCCGGRVHVCSCWLLQNRTLLLSE